MCSGGIYCGFELIGGEMGGFRGHLPTLTDGVGHAWGVKGESPKVISRTAYEESKVKGLKVEATIAGAI